MPGQRAGRRQVTIPASAPRCPSVQKRPERQPTRPERTSVRTASHSVLRTAPRRAHAASVHGRARRPAAPVRHRPDEHGASPSVRRRRAPVVLGCGTRRSTGAFKALGATGAAGDRSQAADPAAISPSVVEAGVEIPHREAAQIGRRAGPATVGAIGARPHPSPQQARTDGPSGSSGAGPNRARALARGVGGLLSIWKTKGLLHNLAQVLARPRPLARPAQIFWQER
jgi:hypothetical protein